MTYNVFNANNHPLLASASNASNAEESHYALNAFVLATKMISTKYLIGCMKLAKM